MFANNGLGLSSNNIGWEDFGSRVNRDKGIGLKPSSVPGFFLPDLTPSNSVTEDWAHEIYLYNGSNKANPQFKNMSRSDEQWTGENLIKGKLIDFAFSPLAHFEKHKIHGHQKNIDLDAVIDMVPNNINVNQGYNNLGLVY